MKTEPGDFSSRNVMVAKRSSKAYPPSCNRKINISDNRYGKINDFLYNTMEEEI